MLAEDGAAGVEGAVGAAAAAGGGGGAAPSDDAAAPPVRGGVVAREGAVLTAVDEAGDPAFAFAASSFAFHAGTAGPGAAAVGAVAGAAGAAGFASATGGAEAGAGGAASGAAAGGAASATGAPTSGADAGVASVAGGGAAAAAPSPPAFAALAASNLAFHDGTPDDAAGAADAVAGETAADAPPSFAALAASNFAFHAGTALLLLAEAAGAAAADGAAPLPVTTVPHFFAGVAIVTVAQWSVITPYSTVSYFSPRTIASRVNEGTCASRICLAHLPRTFTPRASACSLPCQRGDLRWRRCGRGSLRSAPRAATSPFLPMTVAHSCPRTAAF